MISIASKNLFQDKGRFLISVGGVAFAVVLILVLQGLYQGWREKITAYIDSVETDLWVAQEGTQDMFHTPSFLPTVYQEKLQEIQGVKSVDSLYILRTTTELAGEKEMMVVVGFDEDSRIGGPPLIIKGKNTPGKEEIIIDKVFAKNQSLNIDDFLEILNERKKIVGIATGGDMAMAQIAYVNRDELASIVNFKGAVSYFLVQTKDDPQIVKERIEQKIKGVQALFPERFSQNNKKFILDIFLPIISVLVIIGFAVGVAVIGMTIYTLTQEKVREYGILKALGAKSSYLYKIVVEQSLISGVIGYFSGILLTVVIVPVIQELVPEFAVSFRAFDFGWVFVSTILMAMVASYIPIKKITKIDPAIVFKS